MGAMGGTGLTFTGQLLARPSWMGVNVAGLTHASRICTRYGRTRKPNSMHTALGLGVLGLLFKKHDWPLKDMRVPSSHSSAMYWLHAITAEVTVPIRLSGPRKPPLEFHSSTVTGVPE